MDIPYGFDCFAFQREEIKYFASNLNSALRSVQMPAPLAAPATPSLQSVASNFVEGPGFVDTTRGLADYVKFTRKNEDYPSEQILALGRANRLNMSEIDKRLFCGIKIQIGIGVVTNFLRKGLQYKPPVRGRSELLSNGSWTGIMRGLTVRRDAPESYDLALGNFLAWDEEFPYTNFGPFFAVESKLVFLTGSSRRIETSSFGTNMTREIWLTILSFLIVLSLLASLQISWQHQKRRLELAVQRVSCAAGIAQTNTSNWGTTKQGLEDDNQHHDNDNNNDQGLIRMVINFFFIYFTMLLSKPSHEFDELIWPKSEKGHARNWSNQDRYHLHEMEIQMEIESHNLDTFLDSDAGGGNDNTSTLYSEGPQPQGPDGLGPTGSPGNQEGGVMEPKGEENISPSDCHHNHHHHRSRLPASMRGLSYVWSAACLVLASIYSGEMLAVMLLHTDQNIDTIVQLINSKPPIEPVIRQDDFTHNLMLKSLDKNMLKLHNITRTIPRADVYTRQFIESVSERKVALLGDDELIETIYDLYHKYYPLYKSKVSYLQFPISIMYRKDLNASLERKLRRGIVQIFEMGLIHRWYQAQKDTYIQFYDTYERNKTNDKGKDSLGPSNAEQKYKPLSMHHFNSFFRAMLYCFLFALLILSFEIIHGKLAQIGQYDVINLNH